MSSASADQAAEIAAYIAALQFNTVQLYCVASAITLLVYHYLTTLDLEYTHFWAKRRFGLPWALFLANRYLPLVAYIYQAPWWPVTYDPTRCAAIVISQYILEFSQYALWGSIACLRVYALGRSRALSVLVLVLALVPVVFDIVLLAYMHPRIDLAAGCLLDSSHVPFELYEIIDVLAYTAWVLSEAIVVGVTLAATRHHKSLVGALGRGQTSLSAVLFRNGLIYFVTLTVLNITQLIVNIISIARPSAGIALASSVLSFIAPLTSILLTRFYFDLQETVYPPSRSAGAAPPGWSGTTGALDFSLGTHTLAFAGPESDSSGQLGSSTSSSPSGSDVHTIELEMQRHVEEPGLGRSAIL